MDLDDLDDYEGVLDLTTRDKFREAFAPFGNILDARIRKKAAKAQDALDENRLGYKRSEYEKYEVKKQIIRKGDVISLKDILFTKNRDYLVRITRNVSRLSIWKTRSSLFIFCRYIWIVHTSQSITCRCSRRYIMICQTIPLRLFW